MEQVLCEKDGYSYLVSDVFSGAMLAPVIQNLLQKAQTDWDDYDEVYHCCRLVEAVRLNPAMKMEFHHIKRSGNVVGLGVVTQGKLDPALFFPNGVGPKEPLDQVLVFNTFHVAPQVRGRGAWWLRDVIFPHYAEQGFQVLYVKSSHEKALPLYTKLGQAVGNYSGKSDNGLFERSGTLFRIPLSKG